MEVPGVKSEQIDLSTAGDELTIKIERPDVIQEDEDQHYLAREYGVGDYYCTFHASEAIDAGWITAEYADGVLSLHLPKAESIKPRKISVNTK